jgi:hypothetical protein
MTSFAFVEGSEMAGCMGKQQRRASLDDAVMELWQSFKTKDTTSG